MVLLKPAKIAGFNILDGGGSGFLSESAIFSGSDIFDGVLGF